MVALLAGCAHYGPKTVAVDRFDYAKAISDSWKDQTLLNIVRLRYMDLPVFMDVASIVAGYSIEATASAGGGVNWPSSGSATSNVSVGGAARYTERPTITYVPMTGEKFLRGLITPIDPKQIFFMLQSGYAADFILGLTVESLNGVRNRSAAGGAVREADPAFGRVLQLLREVQFSGAVGMRVEQDETKGETVLLIFSNDEVTSDVAAKSAEIRQLLKLTPGLQNFTLRYSPMRGSEDELAVNSRSMLQIMQAFASYVDVPAVHLNENRATPTFEAGPSDSVQRPVRILSGKQEPADAFAAVSYRDHWFWIDDGDLRTKRAFTAIMFFFTLADTGGGEELPLITIPAQ
jgi:hypothetical protein